jgi:hypothetical protein
MKDDEAFLRARAQHYHDMSDDGSEGGQLFSYIVEEGGDIPEDATSVKAHPSVRAINKRAFVDYSQLTVYRGDGLEEIGEERHPFVNAYRCMSFRSPTPSVRLRRWHSRTARS